jgi:hypothetical protein
MAAFADQIDNGPVLLARLDAVNFKGSKFGAAQSAANQERDHRAIARLA